MTLRNSVTKAFGSWPGRSRTSSSAEASGEITFVLPEPSMAVSAIVFRTCALRNRSRVNSAAKLGSCNEASRFCRRSLFREGRKAAVSAKYLCTSDVTLKGGDQSTTRSSDLTSLFAAESGRGNEPCPGVPVEVNLNHKGDFSA